MIWSCDECGAEHPLENMFFVEKEESEEYAGYTVCLKCWENMLKAGVVTPDEEID